MVTLEKFNKDLSQIKSWAHFEEIAKNKSTEKEKGDLFEQFSILWFKQDPLYSSRIKNIWPLSKVPNNVREFIESGKSPKNLPRNLDKVYKEFKGWHEFLGTKPSTPKDGWMPYDEASELAQKHGIKTQVKYTEFCRSEKRPERLPIVPQKTYKEWKGWHKFLGK
tara:strand:- start:1661 stop:2155 length:495 start_codon:yes stop_codon:yes gene_type:complete